RPGVESLIALEDDKITLPSVVFFNMEERRPVYGRLALHEYLEGYEGRLMRSLKSLLGSKLIQHDTSVLGTAMPFKDLLALFIGELKKRAAPSTRPDASSSKWYWAARCISSMTMHRPIRKPKTHWPKWPARSASRTYRSSSNLLLRHSTTSPPSKTKSWY
ncbi:Heat shock protein YegD, partial [Pseudomonas amygdali pv. lachrymans]